MDEKIIEPIVQKLAGSNSTTCKDTYIMYVEADCLENGIVQRNIELTQFQWNRQANKENHNSNEHE